LLLQLLAIPGRSGQERDVAGFIVRQLKESGAESAQLQFDTANRKTPEKSDTGNLVFKLPGTQRGPRRLLSAHMDTVPICVGCRPVRRGNRVESAGGQTGLGADDRAGVAVLLSTAMSLLRGQLPHPPLTFLWTVQEETGLHGARLASLSLLGKPRMGFNWDGGSATKLTIGATGGYRMEIAVNGQASHAGGAPERGISAIAIAALAIADLQRGGWHGKITHRGSQGTSNIGLIEGGAATNVVAERVLVRAEARSHDPLFRQRIVREIEKTFRRAAREVKNDRGQAGRVAIRGRLDYESFCLATDEPAVQAARQVIESLGSDADLAIANGGLDANWLNARGIPTVTLGCGQVDQHMVTEALDLDEFHTACRIAIRLACGAERNES
jgi:tripeptide aminopeptidase